MGAVRLLASALVALAIATGSAGAAAAEARLALVIEQAKYRGNLTPLPGTKAEADAVAGALATLGFATTRKRDLDKDGLRDALTAFRRGLAAEKDAIGFLYFTGHGARDPGSAAGDNFLLGVEADLAVEADLTAAGLRLSDITAQMSATGARAVIIVADACRNTPSFGKAGAKGFAAVAAETNTLVAYATDVGQIAEVGVYAPALAAELVKPGRTIAGAFEEIQIAVARATKGKQRPWSNNRIYDRICLAGCELDDAPPPPPVKPAPAIDPDAAAWSAVARDCDAKAYLAAFPKGAYAAAAAIRAGRCDEAARPKPGDPVDEPPGRSEPARFSVSAPEAELKRRELLRAVEAELKRRADGKPVVDGATVTAATPAGTVFKDCADCPEMIVIPAGAFLMGSPASESWRDEDEDDAPGAGGRPRRVTFPRAFAVSRTEVTRGEFAAFDAETARADGANCFTDRDGNGSWEPDPKGTWRDPGFAQGDDHPVVCVDWNDAKAYAAWLDGRAGRRGYRLLSEAEWEYMARAGTPTAYITGDDPKKLCGVGNVRDRTAKRAYSKWNVADCEDGYVHTAPAGRYSANSFGVFDTHGNVWEWVGDCYKDSYAGAPGDGSAVTTGDCSRRVLRGGSWNNDPGELRSAIRFRSLPTLRGNYIGFRLARTL